MPAKTSDLSVYLDYEYLAAEQLGGLLLGLHGVYDEFLYADAPFLRQLPTAPAARLRVDTVETGNSVTVYLAHGITQLAGSADPSLVGVASGTTALAATGALVLRMLHRFEDLRAKVMRDNRENERAQLELADKGLDLAAKAVELSVSRGEAEQVKRAQLSEVRTLLAEHAPDRAPAQQEALATRLAPHLDAITQIISAESIRGVRIVLPDPPAGRRS